MDSLLSLVTCSLCKKPFADVPKVLPGCLHVFCRPCLDNLPIALGSSPAPPTRPAGEDEVAAHHRETQEEKRSREFGTSVSSLYSTGSEDSKALGASCAEERDGVAKRELDLEDGLKFTPENTASSNVVEFGWISLSADTNESDGSSLCSSGDYKSPSTTGGSSKKKAKQRDSSLVTHSSTSSDISLSIICPKCGRSSALSAASGGLNALRTSYVALSQVSTYKAVQRLQSKLSNSGDGVRCDQCLNHEEPAVTYCGTCQQLMCNDHTKCHSLWKEFSVHNFFPLSSLCRSDSRHSSTSSGNGDSNIVGKKSEFFNANSGLKDSVMVRRLASPLSLGDIRCLKHSKQPAKFFCSMCEDLACVNCTSSTHKDSSREHDCISITPEMLKEKRAEVVKSLESLDDLVHDLDTLAGHLQTRMEAVAKKASLKKDEIEAVFNEIVDTLESRKLALFEEVDAIVSAPMTQLKVCEKKVDALRDHALDSRNFVQENLSFSGELGLLSLAGVISSHSTEVVSEYKNLLLPEEQEVEIPEIHFFETRNQLYDSIAEFGKVRKRKQFPSSSSPSSVSGKYSSSPPPAMKKPLSALSLRPFLRQGSLPAVCPLESSIDIFNTNLQDSLTGSYVYSSTLPHTGGGGGGKSPLKTPAISPVVIDFPKMAGIHLRDIRGLKGPSGIRVDRNFKLVVCEFGTHQVASVYQNGMEIHRLGREGEKGGQFLYPQSTACDSQGRMLVVDSMYRIQMFDRNGKFLKSVGTKGKGQLQFHDPVSVVIAPGNNKKVFVCERQNHRIQVLNPDLSFHSFIGKPGRGECEFYLPNDIALDRDSSQIYIADSGNHRIQILTLQGQFVRSFGKKGSAPGELSLPSHLCVDGEGVYVTEEGNHRLSVFSLNGMIIRFIGGGGKGSEVGQFHRPLGVAIDRNKTLYVCDSKNNRIQVFK